MMGRAGYGLILAALLLTGACSRGDTDMTEAFWCASYGTCKSGVTQAAMQAQPAAAVADCSYYGTCNQQQQAPAYNPCAFYGVCSGGS